MLAVTNLKAGYDGKVVVDIPGFVLNAGEHCLITGPSGSGKSTLLYVLAGLLTPIYGAVRIADVDIGALGPTARDAFRGKNIGIIYQSFHLIPALTVLQNLQLAQYGAGLKQDRERAEELLEGLGILAYADRKPESLSQGQQQRACIARAAINGPRLILGDEPTSALDDESCEEVMHLMLAIAQQSNASLIVATHDPRIKKHFTRHIEVPRA
jgi:putative ABC transport system ATP-binding protein